MNIYEFIYTYEYIHIYVCVFYVYINIYTVIKKHPEPGMHTTIAIFQVIITTAL